MDKVFLTADRLYRSVALFQPWRPVLVSSMNSDGSVNVAPFSWVTPVSMCPPMVSLALMSTLKRQHTLENIEREGEFVVNLPDMQIVEQMIRTAYNYPEGMSKFTLVGFGVHPSQVVQPPGVAECRAHLECKLTFSRPTGDHTLLVAEVVAASYDSEVFDESLLLRLDKCRPCLHLRHFRLEGGQMHIFAWPLAEQVVNVPYGEGRPDIDFLKEGVKPVP